MSRRRGEVSRRCGRKPCLSSLVRGDWRGAKASGHEVRAASSARRGSAMRNARAPNAKHLRLHYAKRTRKSRDQDYCNTASQILKEKANCQSLVRVPSNVGVKTNLDRHLYLACLDLHQLSLRFGHTKVGSRDSGLSRRLQPRYFFTMASSAGPSGFAAKESRRRNIRYFWIRLY